MPMVIASTCKELGIREALDLVADGAAFVDLRPTHDYLDVHIPSSVALLWEFGPGMAARARDTLPLSLPLVLCDQGTVDMTHAAVAFRGKGFTVMGRVTDAINAWASETSETPASTETVSDAPKATILDVGDPGVHMERAPDMHIALDSLWGRVQEVTLHDRIAIAAGYGVRAAVAVGILERAGARDILFWRTRPES
jgi:rhodanese-related sulfurtransferase